MKDVTLELCLDVIQRFRLTTHVCSCNVHAKFVRANLNFHTSQRDNAGLGNVARSPRGRPEV